MAANTQEFLGSSTTEESSVVPQSLASYIATRDRRIAKLRPWSKSVISDNFSALLRGEKVIVGGRATCGSTVDPTWVELTAWTEVVSKARAFGFHIQETPIKHGNGWATKAGGFWQESAYCLCDTHPTLGSDHERD